MNPRWTDAENEWLRENYLSMTVSEAVVEFERRFGRKVTPAGVYSRANKMGLSKTGRTNERRVKTPMRWSSPKLERECEWLLANDVTESTKPTIEAFEREFGVRLTGNQVSAFRSAHGTQKKAPTNDGRTYRPVGYERVGPHGRIVVKVADKPTVPGSKDNWRLKHHIVYEEAFGPIPEGHTVMLADGDPLNLDPENLVAVPSRCLAYLASHFEWHDRETLEAAVNLTLLNIAVNDLKNKPRPCAICGKVFAPEYRSNRLVKTCPECGAKGRKHVVFRGSCGEAECAVCGKTFNRNKSNQRRCPECIAEKPKHSAEAHALARGAK